MLLKISVGVKERKYMLITVIGVIIGIVIALSIIIGLIALVVTLIVKSSKK